MTKKINALREIRKKLKSLSKQQKKIDYFIPSLWLNNNSKELKKVNVNPFEFYDKKINEVLKYNENIKNKKEDLKGIWSYKAITYNIFVRLTTAYDHNGDRKIDTEIKENEFRETGTFLKTIALLPLIKKMGVNTLHFLPITSIGHDGNKGNLGSPYAIKNPNEIDENLAEPILGFSVDFQFKALIEAAKRMGFRIILEFVFRTSAKDSDWVKEHPEWFYWIKDEIEIRLPGEIDENKYGSPIFSEEELKKIHDAVNENNFDSLVPPSKIYKDMYTDIPIEVEYINGKYIGTTQNGEKVKIPGAFADWPPDDNQPPWSDVTYLRMYDHPDFNYIAYNTIRMYDSNLAKKENINKPLWNKIVNIIPHYQKEFDIDGVMIDMGHALPTELLKAIQKKARKNNPYFAFWEENFSLTEKSIEQGYNVTLGYLWCDEYDVNKLRSIFNVLASSGFPLPFFATSETHNTPRAFMREGGLLYSKYSFAINCFLPAIVFIHSGFELLIDQPVNTGLDFTIEQQKKYPSLELPLFSESSFNWNEENNLINFIKKTLMIRKKYEKMIINRNPSSFETINFKNEKISGFIRKNDKQKIIIIANSNFESEEEISINLFDKTSKVKDLISSKNLSLVDGLFEVKLNPGEVKILLK